MLIRNAVAAVVCLLLAAGGASAAYKSGPRQGPCMEDAKKLCSNVKPGGGRIYQCMTSHEAELTPACRDHIAQAKARLQQFQQACKADEEKFCKGVKPGQGRVLSCLKSHETDLAPACREEFTRSRSDTTVSQ
ncbi:MAG: cysteine rich repeat-containing protein [Sulfurifustaceae bacterium]